MSAKEGSLYVCQHVSVCTWRARARPSDCDSVFWGSSCSSASSPNLQVPCSLGEPRGGKQDGSELPAESSQP